jgi:thiaminase/transcriptional activator TenA
MPDRTAGSASFTQRCWSEIEPVRRAILEHPFLVGLVDGSLPEQRFRSYIVQDSLYLRSYARTLAALAAKAQAPADTALLAGGAAQAVAVEQELHAELLGLLGLTSGEVETARALPTTLAYTSFLDAVALRDTFLTGVASVLPCFWIYAEVGDQLVRGSSQHPVYRRWIESYAAEEYGEVVASVIELTDRAAAEVAAAEDARARRAFSIASRYEWMFWDAAWREETWPLAVAGETPAVGD